MAKVKIFLDENETQQEAEHALVKALTAHDMGETHKENFDDPAMAHLESKLEIIHSTIYKEMLQEIFDVLDQDYIK